MTRSVGGGTLDLALVIESGLVNQEYALSIVRNDPGASAAEDLEAVLEPRDLRQRSADELYDKLGLCKESLIHPQILRFFQLVYLAYGTYLFVLERDRVLQFKIETGCAGGDGGPLQGDCEGLGDLARLRKSQSVLRPDTELVTPSRLETAQSQLRESAKAGVAS